VSRRRARRIGSTAFLLVFAMGVTACAAAEAPRAEAEDDWQGILAAAKEEGVATVYVAWLPTAMEAVEKGFEAEYPDIDLQITRIMPPEVDSALDAELAAGGGPDAVSSTNYTWMMSHLDDFAELKGPDSVADQWADYTFDGKAQVANISALAISYNTDRVSAGDAPTSYEDLLDPKYRGRVGIVDNIAGPMADMYQWLEDTYPGYWEGLAAQEPKIYGTAVPIQEALLQGEIDVALWGSNALVQSAKADGASIDWVLVEPGWGPPAYTYLLGKSAHPNAAQVLANWLATPAGQSAVAKNDITVLPDVEGTAGDASGLTVLDVERVVEPGWLEDSQSRWREAFGR
jgi:iron(III) transport system substrate-binding protein